MTSISSTTRAQPAQSGASDPIPGRAQPADVRAMRDAIEAARGKLEKPAGQPARKQGAGVAAEQKRDGVPQAPVDGRTQKEETALARATTHRENAEGLTGWNGQGGMQAAAPMVANFPAPHVDPGAFAQMLADLWTRENGKGSKEVRVRFGDGCWPATGARLVRTAAGTLDVALLVGDGGGAYRERLGGLEDALTGAGIDLGALAIERDG